MPSSITCGAGALRGMRVVFAFWLSCSPLLGCRGGEVDALRDSLVLRTLSDCAPDRVLRLVVEPLGDFAPREQAAFASDLSRERILFTGLPPDTEWFRLRVETPDPDYRAFALGRASRVGQALDALVLPLTRTCSVLEDALSGFDARAIALAGEDGLLLAGGLDADGASVREAQLLQVSRAELSPDARGLDVERAYATAVTLADETWVLGGAWAEQSGSPAWDTFDRYDAVNRKFVGLGRMRARRVLPAALRLANDSLLVAGGTPAVGGEPLTSLETVSADASSSELWRAELPFAAERLGLFARDDGRVVALGTVRGRTRMASVYPGTRGVEELPGPALREGALVLPTLAAALPGGRLALVEVDASSDTTTGRVFIQLYDDSFVEIADPREAGKVTWLASIAGITQGRLLALPDGRLLLTGLRQDAPIARLLDPARRDVATRALDIAVERLFLRADGSVLLAGPEGVRILREDARSPFDNPGGNLLADDSGALCLDAYGRFEREGLGLRATVADARFDLVPLRYRSVRIELSVEGPAELLLRRADGAERIIEVGGAQVGPAYCQLAVPPGRPLLLERREDRLIMRSDKLEKSCQLDGMTGPVALALRTLESGVRVTDLRATRL